MKETTKCYCGHTTTCDCGPEQDFKDIELPQQERQETLEEAVEKSFGEIWSTLTTEQSDYLKDYINRQRENAKKWQQERSYSEEEVKEILKLRLNWFGISSNAFEDNKWFEQFKKK